MSKPNGFTTIEIAIIACIGGIGFAVAFGIANGERIVPNKQECLNAGGKWTEGIQYGRMIQLCSYN
jgi:hypothetical protein